MRLSKDVAKNRNLLSLFILLLAVLLFDHLHILYLIGGLHMYTVGLKYGASRTSNLSLFQKSLMVNSSPGIPILS